MESNVQAEEMVKTVTNAAVALFMVGCLQANVLSDVQAQTAMCDHVAKTGHMSKIFSLMDGPVKHPTAAQIMHQLTNSQVGRTL